MSNYSPKLKKKELEGTAGEDDRTPPVSVRPTLCTVSIVTGRGATKS